MAATAPAGWYDDGSGRDRWWDGSQWTDEYATDGANKRSNIEQTALLTFVSHILGKNARVWIYEDRIEYERKAGVSAGKIAAGVMTGGLSLAATGVGKGAYGAGAKRRTEVIPVKAITSVTTRRDGFINTVVAIATPAGVIDMRVGHADAEKAKRLLTELILRPAQPTVVVHTVATATPAPAAAQPDATEQIAKLAELHRAGILTDDEFGAAKAKALGI